MRKLFENMSDVERENCAILGGGCLTLLMAFVIIAVVSMLTGCRSPREIVHEVTVVETHDSIYYVHDTLYHDVPSQTAQVITHDSVSQLENDYAVSVVSLNKDGTLTHKLNTKPQSVPIPYQKPIETKTQVIYKDKRIEVPVPVEKKLTAWEQFRLRSFWVLLAVALAALVWVFRKPMFTMIRRLIK
ncbi:MAG: hypothetical protein IKP11_04445 [Paludibacteraceae bacterium]|nr:hypothetical protein [Paludibacteraceae bacterium]